MHGLTIFGTWFRRLNVHRWTWISNDGITRKEIDHTLTRKQDRYASYRVFCGAEVSTNTDHLLVISDSSFRISMPKKSNSSIQRYNTQCLTSNSELQHRYNVAVVNPFDCLQSTPDNFDEAWTSSCNVIRSCADEVLGLRKNLQTLVVRCNLRGIARQAAAKLRNDTTQRKRLQGVFKAKAKADRSVY